MIDDIWLYKYQSTNTVGISSVYAGRNTIDITSV